MCSLSTSIAALGGRTTSAAELPVSTRAELTQALRKARAGDQIVIAAGTYAGGISQSGLAGTRESPIMLTAADPANPPVISGGNGGLHLSSPSHVELRHLVIKGSTGNGLNIDDGGSPGSAHDVVLHRIVAQDIGPKGNRDGIKLSGLNQFRVEQCEVRRWGDGGSAIDMVGCHDGVVTDCRFAEATGDAANGVQAKGGSSNIVVRRSRFENSGGRAVNAGGSTGLPYFRPSDATFEARNITVEDCEFIGGMAAVAFVGVDGALVQHNTIYRPRRWAFRILQENTDPRFVSCRNGRVVNNVVAFQSDELSTAVNVGAMTAPDSFEFSGNQWRCLDRPGETKRLVRLPVEETDGAYDAELKLADPEKGDVSLPTRGAADPGVREKLSGG
jgi:hypothetical protein